MNPLPTDAPFRSPPEAPSPVTPPTGDVERADLAARMLPALLFHDMLFRQRNHWDGTRWVPRPAEQWDGMRFVPYQGDGA